MIFGFASAKVVINFGLDALHFTISFTLTSRPSFFAFSSSLLTFPFLCILPYR